MNISLESEPHPFIIDKAAYAVADAMMFAQAEQLIYPLKTQPRNRDIRVITKKYTKERCNSACQTVLENIRDNHRDLFQAAIKLRAERDVKPLNAGWPFHCYFLVQDINSMWYAGSPANYIAKEPDDNQRLTRVISSTDLSEVLSIIETIEGGLWPTVEQITTTLNDVPYKKLRIEPIPEVINWGK